MASFQGMWFFRIFMLMLIQMILAVVPEPVTAQTMALNDLVLHNRAGEVNLRFGIEVQDAHELEEVLDDGGIVELRCTISLLRKRGLFWDKELSEHEFISQVDSNALTREFIVRTEGTDKIHQGKLLPEILQNSWGMIDIGLGPWSRLERGREYRVVLKLVMERVDIPLWLKHSLFFWSWDLTPEAVYELNFTY